MKQCVDCGRYRILFGWREVEEDDFYYSRVRKAEAEYRVRHVHCDTCKTVNDLLEELREYL